MATPVGLRKVKVLKDVPANTLTTLDRQGSFLFLTVTNTSDSPIDFTPNYFPENGLVSDAIPIEAGDAIDVPLMTYNFIATGTVTVIAYGM